MIAYFIIYTHGQLCMSEIQTNENYSNIQKPKYFKCDEK